MKKLVCEMCGSTDLVKQDGMFVCQYCGAKYTVEEAKKMMIEGTVNITGSTVKVDNTEQIDNLYTLARRAKQTHDFVGAEKYYSKMKNIAYLIFIHFNILFFISTAKLYVF